MPEDEKAGLKANVKKDYTWVGSLLKLLLDRVLILMQELEAELVTQETISKRRVNELLGPVRNAVAACEKWPEPLPESRQMQLLIYVFRLATLMEAVERVMVPAQQEIQWITSYLMGVREKGTMGS